MKRTLLLLPLFAALLCLPSSAQNKTDSLPSFSKEKQKYLLKKARNKSNPSQYLPPLLKIIEFGEPSKYRKSARNRYNQLNSKQKINGLTSCIGYREDFLRPVIYRRIGNHVDLIKKKEQKRSFARKILQSMVVDKYQKARDEAIEVSKKLIHRREINKILKPIVNSDNRVARINAVAAMGRLGDPFMVPVVVKRYHRVYGESQRGHVFFGQQTAYIRDIDPQVATGAVAADPDIDTVSEGFVLDAKVEYIDEYLIVIEWKTARHALHNIVGKEIGENPDEWMAWLKKNRNNIDSWIKKTAPDSN